MMEYMEYAEYTQREQEIYDLGFASGATAALLRTCNILEGIDSRFERVRGEPSLRTERPLHGDCQRVIRLILSWQKPCQLPLIIQTDPVQLFRGWDDSKTVKTS